MKQRTLTSTFESILVAEGAISSLLLAEFDAETRFALRAARGKGKQERGLELLAKAGTN